MQELLRYMPLDEGEKVLGNIDGVLYYVAPNGVLQLLYSIIRFLAILSGCQTYAHVFVTNKRVIVIKMQKTLWFFIGSLSVTSIPARSVSAVGCYFTRTFLLCKNYYLEFCSRNARFYISANAGENSVHEMIRNILSLQINS